MLKSNQTKFQIVTAITLTLIVSWKYLKTWFLDVFKFKFIKNKNRTKSKVFGFVWTMILCSNRLVWFRFRFPSTGHTREHRRHLTRPSRSQSRTMSSDTNCCATKGVNRRNLHQWDMNNHISELDTTL